MSAGCESFSPSTGFRAPPRGGPGASTGRKEEGRPALGSSAREHGNARRVGGEGEQRVGELLDTVGVTGARERGADTLRDPEERAGEQECGGSERDLQPEADEEGRLDERVQAEAPVADEPLEVLLEQEADRGNRREDPRRRREPRRAAAVGVA